MEEIENNSIDPVSETLISDTFVSRVSDFDQICDQDLQICPMDEDEESSTEYMVCDWRSRLIHSGFIKSNSTEEVVMFVNAGGEVSVEANADKLSADNFFDGGDVFKTEESIVEAGDYPFVYQSARLGDFCYRFTSIEPGEYFVDLHFVEIINTWGPKGMRVFNVFIQDEKVLADFDIFSVVGANKPLQLVDSRVCVKDDGVIFIRFEGVNGSPIVSGICIRRAPKLEANEVTSEHLICTNCATSIEVPTAQLKVLGMKSTAKYEKKIQDLSSQCQLKADECYQAWMSLASANDQLEKVRMELDNKLFQTYSLDQTVEKQAEKLKDVSSKYERDKKFWVVTISDLDQKIKTMKQEHSKLSREAHECADSIPELNKMSFAVQELVAQCEDLKVKYSEEQAKRRKLHNEVQEAKGNIRVFCRCRPLSKAETSVGCSTVVDFIASKDGELGILAVGNSKKTFKFDRVYTPKADQVDVFADAFPMVISVLDGYNVCIFAYGQTGTGKTFTMEGTADNRGVNYRTLEELFNIAKERKETFRFDISVSVLEVYNEQIRDLLATTPSSKKLEIKQAPEGSHHIPGIVEAKVENIKEVWNVLQAGSSARAVGSNNVNEHSSRSHCMLCIMVKSKNLINGECTKSKLWLVDLAGSERLAKTDAQGDRLKEAQNINRSLSALGDVISALANKSNHIPYRNSKLTHLLQDSLGGDSKTLMFVQISPSDQDSSETLSSLNFATRVRGVELGPVRKQIDTAELQKIKLMLDKAKQESRLKDESLRKLEDSLQNYESKARGKDQLYRTQLEKIKELEGQLEMRTALHCQSEKQVSSLSERLKQEEDVCSGLRLKVKELESRLRELEQEHRKCSTYQEKVKDLEKKLKDRGKESLSNTVALEQKIEQLERNLLREQEQSTESLLLRQKIGELEEKLREQEERLQSQQEQQLKLQAHEQEMACTLVDSTNAIRSNMPLLEGNKFERDELMIDTENCVLKSSNSMKRPMSQGSALPKGRDSLVETRRRRLSRNSETENVASNLRSGDTKGRQSDPPRLISRTPRVTKPASGVQRPITRTRVTARDQQIQGTKATESKKRVWTR
ncbi:hypothetical protein AgCh_025348 [Apium graveolens]